MTAMVAFATEVFEIQSALVALVRPLPRVYPGVGDQLVFLCEAPPTALVNANMRFLSSVCPANYSRVHGSFRRIVSYHLSWFLRCWPDKNNLGQWRQPNRKSFLIRRTDIAGRSIYRTDIITCDIARAGP